MGQMSAEVIILQMTCIQVPIIHDIDKVNKQYKHLLHLRN